MKSGKEAPRRRSAIALALVGRKYAQRIVRPKKGRASYQRKGRFARADRPFDFSSHQARGNRSRGLSSATYKGCFGCPAAMKSRHQSSCPASRRA